MSKEKAPKETKKTSEGKKSASKGDKSKDDKVSFFKNIAKFFLDCKNEIKKIVWPTPKSVFKNTGIVLVVILIIGLFVFGLDTALVNLLGLFMSVAGG